MKRWTYATVAVAAVLFVLACRDDFYRLTSPPELSWHVLLRKIYSIVAFTVVGYLATRASREHGRNTSLVGTAAVTVAAYSGLIELGQYFAGSREGLLLNAIDVACGAIGGLIGARFAYQTATTRPYRRGRG